MVIHMVQGQSGSKVKVTSRSYLRHSTNLGLVGLTHGAGIVHISITVKLQS